MALLNNLFEWAAMNYTQGSSESPSIGVSLSVAFLGKGQMVTGQGDGTLTYYPSAIVHIGPGPAGFPFPPYFSGPVNYTAIDSPKSIEMQITAPRVNLLFSSSTQETYEAIFSVRTGKDSVLLAEFVPQEASESGGDTEPAGVLYGAGSLFSPGTRQMAGKGTITIGLGMPS